MIEEFDARDFREDVCILRPHEYLKLHGVTGICKYRCDLSYSYHRDYNAIDQGLGLHLSHCRISDGVIGDGPWIFVIFHLKSTK